MTTPKTIQEMLDNYPYRDMMGNNYRAGLISAQREIKKWINYYEKGAKEDPHNFAYRYEAAVNALKKIHGGLKNEK